MKYYVTHFQIKTDDEALFRPSCELLAAIAGECGYESFMDTDTGVDGYVQVDMYDEQSIVDGLADFPVDGVSLHFVTEEVENQNWNETWEQEQGFEPISIAGKVLIYDLYHTDESDISQNSEEIKIGIEARNAFGTGTHETTRMMVSRLIASDLRGKRILDCGCGTGILAIAAIKCGAGEVVAYDIDEWSVENALHNGRINGVEDRLHVLEGDANVLSHVSGVFDVVMANINRNILLNDMEMFHSVMNKGAHLMLSGFYDTDVQILSEKAESLGLTLVDKIQEGEWCSLEFYS